MAGNLAGPVEATGMCRKAIPSRIISSQNSPPARRGIDSIVVPGNPHPFAAGLQRGNLCDRFRIELLGRMRAVKAVAQRNNAPDLVEGNRLSQTDERFARVVGWQEHAASRVGGAFLQVKIGDQQRAMRGPERHAGTICQQVGATDEYGKGAVPTL